VFELAKAKLEKVLLRTDQLISLVHLLFEMNRRWRILEAGHFESFHHRLVMIAWLTSLAVLVETHNFDSAGPVAPVALVITIGDFVLDRNPSTCAQLLDEFTG